MEIFTSVAANVFSHMKQYFKQTEVITNSKIKGIVADIKLVGGAIHFEKSNCMARVLLKAKDLHTHALHDFSQETSNSTLTKYLAMKHRCFYKSLFAERSREILLQAHLRDKQQITAALRGGSTQKLVQSADFIPFPLALNDLDNPDKLICDAEGVKSMTRDYFTRLYDHSQVPILPKPWLDTPSVKKVNLQVAEDPFVWPLKASLSDFCAVLRCGNSKPSPGPDGWEKWMIKSLSDDTLTLVLDLHNYQVMNSCFPGNIKDMWLTMFHKHGL